MSAVNDLHLTYLDTATSGRCSARVIDTQIEYLSLEAEVGASEARRICQPDIERFYDSAASLIGARPDEIAYVDSGTRGLNVLLRSLVLPTGSEVVTLASEFGSNLIALDRMCRAMNLALRIVPCRSDGSVDLSVLEQAVSHRTKVVVVSHCSPHCSLVNPVAEIGELLSGLDLFYLVDACQSTGQIGLSVADIGCHGLVATGRKWLGGPRGSGFIYIDSSWTERMAPIFVDRASFRLEGIGSGRLISSPTVDGARRFELWERNISGMLGLGLAIEERASLDMASVHSKISSLRTYCMNKLSRIDGLVIHGQRESDSGIIGFSLDGCEPKTDGVRRRLLGRGFAVTVVDEQMAPGHFALLGITSMVRVSPDYTNSTSEIDALTDAVECIVDERA